MKILLLSNMYPSRTHKYYAIYVKHFAKGFQKYGANIELCVIKGRGRSLFSKIFKYIWYFIFSTLKLIFGKYDAVYVHSVGLALIPVSFVGWLIRKPVIVNAHGTDLLRGGRMDRVIFFLNERSFKKASLIVLPSLMYLEKVERLIRNDNFFISASGGVDRYIFHPKQSVHAPPNTSAFTIGYVSRIDHGKGWDVFLDVVQALKEGHKGVNFRAFVVGSGIQEQEMVSEVSKRKLNTHVQFIGQVSHDDLAEVYNCLDVLVFPTLLEESLGLVGLEAMSCGVPVVASNIGALPEYVREEENGFLCTPGDIDSFLFSVLKVYQLCEAERNRYTLNCVETAKLYDSTLVSRALFLKVKELVDQNG